MAFYSPLRYPGGKGKLAKHIKSLLTHNNLCDHPYAEIYAGGAGVAIELLLEGYSSEIHINDLNISVYAFWYSVLNHTEELVGLINSTEVTMETWEQQKRVQKTPHEHTTLELGFSTFFLNRTNRSGIIKAGVIGGKNQDGVWKLDARFGREELITRIRNIASKSKFIHLYNLDAIDFIDKCIPTFQSKTLIYFDPPYYVKGKGLYDNYYSHQDHENVAKKIMSIKNHPWLVTYDDVSQIESMYLGLQTIRYNLNYSASTRYRGTEIMFLSNELLVPTDDEIFAQLA